MATPVYRILAAVIPLQIAAMIAFAVSFRPVPAPASGPASDPGSPDHIVISKSRHTLTLYSHHVATHTYAVALGRAAGPKQQQGDHRTPEGHYLVDGRNPHSRFHLALHLSYPNAADRLQAQRRGVAPGGDVEIHGVLPVVRVFGRLGQLIDWTDGCIALTDPEIDTIYRNVPNGTPVDILP